MSLMILTLLVTCFVGLAIRYWNLAIGAGPTILIVGLIVLSAFGAIKYGQYDEARDRYATCIGRVERSVEMYGFNDRLVSIIERELPTQPFGQELREVMLLPLTEASCGTKPEFFIPFNYDGDS